MNALQRKEAHMEQIITIRDADLTYQARNGEVEALRGVTFSVAEGEFVSIVGPSGCGKSTLLGVLAGLETLDGGTAALRGSAISGPNRLVGFMPQRDQLFEWRTIGITLCWDWSCAGIAIPFTAAMPKRCWRAMG